MLTAALWILGVAVLGGIGLAGLHLAERPITGLTRLASAAHGAVAASGVLLVIGAMLAGRADPAGMGRMAAGFLAVALLGGLCIVAFQLRRRRAPGLVVALHATLGVGGVVILAAYAATQG